MILLGGKFINDYMKSIWNDVYNRGELPWTKNPIPYDLFDVFMDGISSGDSVLDYGCGDGYIALELIQRYRCRVACVDISSNALRQARKKELEQLETYEIESHPSELLGRYEDFKRILVWGVMHHIDKHTWSSYIKDFYKLLHQDGILLIGGHSKKDPEFSEGYRISPTTNIKSHAVDDLEEVFRENNFKIIEEGYFPFKEAFTGENRVFKYFLLKK